MPDETMKFQSQGGKEDVFTSKLSPIFMPENRNEVVPMI